MLQQRTPAWFLAREGKLTASSLGGCLGLISWCSRKKTYERMIGKEKFEGNDATQHGVDNEPNATAHYTAITGQRVVQTGLHVYKHSPFLAGSPDGLVGDKGMIEVKCPYYFRKGCRGIRCHKEIPLYYYVQINALLTITDRDWCDFVSWAPEGVVIHRQFRDELLFDFLLPYYAEFHGCMTAHMDEPFKLPKPEREEIERRVSISRGTMNKDLWTGPTALWLAGQGKLPGPDPEWLLSSSSDDDSPPAKRKAY